MSPAQPSVYETCRSLSFSFWSFITPTLICKISIWLSLSFNNELFNINMDFLSFTIPCPLPTSPSPPMLFIMTDKTWESRINQDVTDFRSDLGVERREEEMEHVKVCVGNLNSWRRKRFPDESVNIKFTHQYLHLVVYLCHQVEGNANYCTITIKKWDRTTRPILVGDSQVKEQGHRPVPSTRYLPRSMTLHHWVRFQTTCRVFTLWVVWNRSVFSSTSQSWSLLAPAWVIHVSTWSSRASRANLLQSSFEGGPRW